MFAMFHWTLAEVSQLLVAAVIALAITFPIYSYFTKGRG